MELCHLIIGHVQGRVVVRPQCLDEVFDLSSVADLYAHKHVRFFRIIITVVELGDIAVTHNLTEFAEAAGTLRNRHRQNSLAALAYFSAL